MFDAVRVQHRKGPIVWESVAEYLHDFLPEQKRREKNDRKNVKKLVVFYPAKSGSFFAADINLG